MESTIPKKMNHRSVCACVTIDTGNLPQLRFAGTYRDSHEMKRGHCPEAAFCSPGQPLPSSQRQVTINFPSVLLLVPSDS